MAQLPHTYHKEKNSMAFDFNHPNIVPEYMDFDVAFEPTKVKDKK